jgi:hypothetical protein
MIWRVRGTLEEAGGDEPTLSSLLAHLPLLLLLPLISFSGGDSNSQRVRAACQGRRGGEHLDCGFIQAHPHADGQSGAKGTNLRVQTRTNTYFYYYYY